MSAIPLKHLAIGVAAGSAFLAGVLPLQADSKRDYPETGTVISATTDQGDVYRIETGAKIYQMECIKAGMFQATPPRCEISGKPIAISDTVHFRLEDDTAYIPASGDHEEKLHILSTELKSLPPLPATTNVSAGESCAVLGFGMDLVTSQYSVKVASPVALSSGTATASGNSPVIPTGPVMAIPVTGGPPVLVNSTGPVTGGMITGMPVTGGAPVTAIPVGPVSGIPIGGPPSDDGVIANANSTTSRTISESEWVPFLRVQTAGQVYKLACASKPCWLKGRAPQLGDLLTIQVQEKVAYLSWQPPDPKGKQKFTILSVKNIDEPQAAPLH